MSGPKSSSYTLSARQRAILLEQQRLKQAQELERRHFQQESTKHNSILKDIQNQQTSFQRQMDRVQQLLHESGRSDSKAEQLQKSVEQVSQQLQGLQKRSPSTSSDMKALNAELQSTLRTLTGVANKAEELAFSLGASYKAELTATIQSSFSLSFSGIGTPKKHENIYMKRINDTLAELGTDIPGPMQEQFQTIRQQADAITSEDYLKNFCAVVVVPFAKACRACDGYNEAKIRYEALCAELHIEARPFACTVEGLSDMKKASEELETAILADRERAYINASLDAAMQEMGYQLVGNRVVNKKTGKHVRHELYSMQNGTAVDVTYADNGQIAMELGGIAQSDRMPTAEETDQLVADMHTFCQDYALLERKLAERGVVTKHISILPPAADYAQIFNANDYEMAKPVSTLEVEANHRQDKQMQYKE